MPSRRRAPRNSPTIFFWRTGRGVPARGRIGIFNRSHYEEVLVVRVHPEMLQRQNLPPSSTGKDIWKHRFKDIRAFERHLVRNGTLVLKFHLRISKEEQRKRFLARLDEPFKRWKFSMNDIAERARWDEYMAAYEDMIRETSTDYAPWYVVPADHKHVDLAGGRRRRSSKRWKSSNSITPRSPARRSRNSKRWNARSRPRPSADAN